MTGIRQIITLTPVIDPLTGKQTFVDLSCRGGVLTPETHEASRSEPSGTHADRDGGHAAGASWTTEEALTEGRCCRLPESRMAGVPAEDPWAEIINTLSDQEDDRPTSSDVYLKPGGALELKAPSGQIGQSKLPEGRMAAVTTSPTAAEARQLRTLDPQRLEGWKLVANDLMAGWYFHLQPPNGARPYEFFAFRSPSDGNLYRIAVLSPKMDDQYGHLPHIISVTVGGTKVNVICGPKGAPARDLDAVRAHAAKWTLYTSRRLAGLNPGFSR
jgi:hypothetical protein